MLICIDPGHYQYTSSENEKKGIVDYGAVGNRTAESTNVLLASTILRDKLEDIGIKVIMTRDEMNETPLNWDRRLKIANTEGVDLIISVHNNSFNEDSCGIETLVSQYCKANDDTMIKADVIHYEVALASKLRNRGLKKATRGLAILDQTKAPAILVELGFISNPQEEALLSNVSWLEKVMDGLVKGICLAYKITPEQNNMSKPKPNVRFKGKELYIPFENENGRNKMFVADMKLLGFKVDYANGMVVIEE